jgi:Lrp/AsnC family leucine-responsive transcriptional regulator
MKKLVVVINGAGGVGKDTLCSFAAQEYKVRNISSVDPIKELAKESFLSSPAASARMERLEKAGVIRGYQARLDHQSLGYHILAFVNIAISPERRPAFREFAASCPNILECHHVTGSYSLILKAAFRSTKDLETFVGQAQTFGTTQTQVVFSTLIDPREIVE